MNSITFYAKQNYTIPFDSDGRAMTIAAFLVSQDSRSLTDAPIRRDVLTFLMTPGAINYWKNRKAWLVDCGKNEEGKSLLKLSIEGLEVCDDSISGVAAVNTSQPKIDHWVKRMRNGDEYTDCSKEFNLPL